MKTYTDQELKRFLAKMLPEKLWIGKLTETLKWEDSGKPVLDTELLHLCWLVETGMGAERHVCYCEDILPSVCGLKGDNSSFTYPQTACWQQRVIALSKINGIEI